MEDGLGTKGQLSFKCRLDQWSKADLQLLELYLDH